MNSTEITGLAMGYAAVDMGLNTSGIRPTEYNVLFLPDEVSTTFKGSSLIKPVDLKDREQMVATKGTIVAVSPLAFGYERFPEGAEEPQAGHRAIIAKHAGMEIEGADGKTYRLIKDKDVVALCD